MSVIGLFLSERYYHDSMGERRKFPDLLRGSRLFRGDTAGLQYVKSAGGRNGSGGLSDLKNALEW